MSSKVSKSEKTKLKFAQSNINHVYRGNTAEPHHKPTVRQYGMQVVGKVQGTRRLPPPAWVPSIKAETGGLDSRVSIVPPGGSGWGAPTESRSASAGAPTELGSTAVPTPLSSVNGSLSREAIGTSFEPAYTRSLGSKPITTVEETCQKGPQVDSQTDDQNSKIHDHDSTAATGAKEDTGTESLSQPVAWTSKTQTSVASGGLAANKPFFQRPPPVTSVTSNSISAKTEERKPMNTSTGGGASEIVGEPSGWAAVTEEEPNFDERILFSDDEESQDDSKSTLKSTPSVRATTQGDVSSNRNAPAFSQSGKTAVLGSLSESEDVSRTETNRSYTSAFSGVSSAYTENLREKPLDAWSTAEVASNFTGYNTPGVSRHSTTLPFSNPMLGTQCGTNTDGDHVLVGHYVSRSIHTQGINPSAFNDAYFPNHVQTGRLGISGGGLLDSLLPPTDADTESQNAQRQARTQEFRSAVERARISRQQRDAFTTEGDSLLQKSVVNLISEPCETSHALPSQTSSQSMLLSSNNSIMPPVLSGAVPQQLLLPSVYQQNASQNRPAIAAAATAAAMACGVNGPPARFSTPTVPPTVVNVPHPQTLPVSSHAPGSMIPGSWQGPTSLPPNIPSTGFNNPKPPTVPQVLQSALSMATSGAPGAHPNGVYLNPDFFVERLLEILNQQQVVRPQSTPQNPPGRTVLQSAESVASNPAQDTVGLPLAGRLGTPNKGVFNEGRFSEGDLAELSQQFESTLKTESPSVTHSVAPVITEQSSICSSNGKQQQQTQQQAKRVPGLMDVKVPTSSRNLAYLWEQGDYLSGSIGRGGRGRSKMFTADKSRGGSRGRRPGGRFASDDINISRTNSGDRRHGMHQTGLRDDYEGTSNVRSWRSKTSRRVFAGPKAELDNSLTTSDIQFDATHNSRPDTKSSYASEPEDYMEEVERVKDDALGSSHRCDTPERGLDSGGSNRQTPTNTKLHAKSTYDTQEDEVNGMRRTDHPKQHERPRRGRGGSGFYYFNSRTFNSEEVSNRYNYNAEQKSYSRTNRGAAQLSGSGTFPTRSHRSMTGVSHFEENRGGHTATEEYKHQRSGRDARFHDREWRSHESNEGKSHQKGRGHSRTLDIRRSSTYREEYNFSDGEHRTGEGRRRQCQQYHTNQRNRSHESSRHTHKEGSLQVISSQIHERTASQSMENERQTQLNTAKDPTTEDGDEVDVPTVHVPAMDTNFKSSRSQYTRGNRSTTFQRGGGIRRIASSRTGVTQQQQAKRSAGSTMQGSRRYRELQNRYRDDKDGDGGAAAGGCGGVGRSTVGGDGTNMFNSGGSSGANGPSDLGDKQNGGGSHNNKGSSKDSIQDQVSDSSGQHQPSAFPDSAFQTEAESNENNITALNGNTTRVRYVTCTSAPSDGHNGQTSTVGIRKDRATNMSTSGGRPSSGQGFRRQGFTRSGYYSKNNTVSSIPPLMSITPEGPFTHSSRDFDSVFNPPNQTINQSDVSKPITTKVVDQPSSIRQNLPDSGPEVGDDQEFSSDGFTKVVSKSSKKQARRRLQMELSAATATAGAAPKRTGVRRLDDTKTPISCPKQHTTDRGVIRSPNSQPTGRTKITEVTVPSKHLTKTKPFPVKPTFMGPPRCSTNGKPEKPTIDEQKLTNSAKAKASNSIASSMVSNGDCDLIGKVNGGRTWSKVVGTKTLSASVAVVKEVDSECPSSHRGDPSWVTEKQPVDKHADQNSVIDECTKDLGLKVIGVTEPAKPNWSSETSTDGNGKIQEAVDNSSEQSNITTSISIAITSSTPRNISSSVATSNTTAVTNVCKVRPQQQQTSPQVGLTSNMSSATTVSTSTITPLTSVTGGQEQTAALTLCHGDVATVDNERIDCSLDAVASQSRNAVRQMDDTPNAVPSSGRHAQPTWSEGLPTQLPGNYFESRISSSTCENLLTTTWPVVDIDPIRGATVQSLYSHFSSDAPYTPNASLTTDPPSKPTHQLTLAARHQPYSMQPYSHSTTNTGDTSHISNIFGASLNEANKLSGNALSQAQPAAFTPMGGPVYVTPQQPSSNQSHQTSSFTAGWTVPSNVQGNPISQGIAPGPRFRQRVTHHLDISSFGGYPFPAELPNEYAFLPSATACVPAPASGRLYSTVQGQPQNSYHSSTRSTLGSSSGATPWSILGNSAGSGGISVSSNEYGASIPPTPIASTGGTASGNTGGGLLPHPIAQGFNSAVTPMSSSPGSTYMTHANYVGVIGGGRPSATELSGNTGRQRSIAQGLYPTHNLSHSPSTQGQQQFQLHSTFYPPLSPSHQRVHLPQFPGAQGRNNIHNFVSPQSNVYAATYGPPPSQPTPPPLHSQMGYPGNFSNETSVAPPGAFHSNVQSHSFSSLGLQPTHPHVHGHRSLQSSGPQMVSRNMGTMNNHGGSALVIPGAVGPSGVSALPGYPQPTPPAPLSVSGYPLKHVLPTL